MKPYMSNYLCDAIFAYYSIFHWFWSKSAAQRMAFIYLYRGGTNKMKPQMSEQDWISEI